MAGTILTTITTLPVWTNFAEPFHLIDRGEVSNGFGGSSTSRIGWQAQFWLVLRTTFLQLKYSYAYLVKNWPAPATLRSKQKIPKSHCLYEQTNFVQPAYVKKIPYSMYANRLVTSMYWVVKWATLSAYTHWPTGCPTPIGPEWKTQAYMNHHKESPKNGPVSMKPRWKQAW